MPGKIKGRRRGHQRMECLDGITDAMSMNSGKLGDGEGQGGLVHCSPWDHKESDMTGQLNNNVLYNKLYNNILHNKLSYGMITFNLHLSFPWVKLLA